MYLHLVHQFELEYDVNVLRNKTTMKIISFNVNGLRARPHQMQSIVDQYSPDIIGLQETKVSNEDFPLAENEALGYSVSFHGQKGHYGVALFSKYPVVATQKGFPWDEDDAQKRLICQSYETPKGLLHVINGYFPQGENRTHETKFPAKKKFYEDLDRYLNESFSSNDQVIVMGDINISPEDCDIGIGAPNAKRWLRTGKCSFLPEEREWLARLKNWGLKDTFRMQHPETNDRFSWFDYRSKGFADEPKRGLRIDVILATDILMSACQSTDVLYDIRAMEKPSDHAPIIAEFDI